MWNASFQLLDRPSQTNLVRNQKLKTWVLQSRGYDTKQAPVQHDSQACCERHLGIEVRKLWEVAKLTVVLHVWTKSALRVGQ